MAPTLDLEIRAHLNVIYLLLLLLSRGRTTRRWKTHEDLERVVTIP